MASISYNTSIWIRFRMIANGKFESKIVYTINRPRTHHSFLHSSLQRPYGIWTLYFFQGLVYIKYQQTSYMFIRLMYKITATFTFTHYICMFEASYDNKSFCIFAFRIYFGCYNDLLNDKVYCFFYIFFYHNIIKAFITCKRPITKHQTPKRTKYNLFEIRRSSMCTRVPECQSGSTKYPNMKIIIYTRFQPNPCAYIKQIVSCLMPVYIVYYCVYR